MKKAPSIHTLEWVENKAMYVLAQIDDEWVPARPLGLFSIKHRLKCAWYAFTGKMDLLRWPKGQ